MPPRDPHRALLRRGRPCCLVRGRAAFTGASLGYGLAYALSARIELAIALHFALNALVFLTLDLRIG